MPSAARALLALALAAACAKPPALSRETRTALTTLRLAQPLEGCLARALGSAESASYLGPLEPTGSELQVHRLRIYTSPVTRGNFLDARVVEARCADRALYLLLYASPKGTTYDAEPEILELRLDSLAEHVAAICHANVIAFERARLVDGTPEACTGQWRSAP